jgi:hypothetical protein
LEYLFHLPTDLEQQVAAVLDLEIRVLISKPAPLLFFQIQSEAQAWQRSQAWRNCSIADSSDKVSAITSPSLRRQKHE